MAKRAAVTKAIEEITEALPHLIRLPSGKAWIDYDEQADVLYISLKRPQKATDTALLDDQGMKDVVLFGGGIIPEGDIPALLEKGVAALFTPGASTEEVAKFLQDHVRARD